MFVLDISRPNLSADQLTLSIVSLKSHKLDKSVDSLISLKEEIIASLFCFQPNNLSNGDQYVNQKCESIYSDI
jgi:hypothetical protein